MEFNTDDFIIRRLGSDDVMFAEQLIQLFKTEFEVENLVPAKPSYLKALLRKHEFICLAATYKGKVIGGLTAYELPMYYSEYTDLFIYDIAVTHELKRKGIGLKLLDAIKLWGAQNYMREIFVDANREDAHALDFYRAGDGFEQQVLQFTFKVNKH